MSHPSNTCLDADVTLSVAQALAGAGIDGLDHVLECGECRARIETWGQLDQALAARELRPDFANQVVAALPADQSSRGSTLAVGALNGGLAFVTAVLVLRFLQAAPSLPSVVLVSAVAAVAALVASTYAPRTEPR